MNDGSGLQRGGGETRKSSGLNGCRAGVDGVGEASVNGIWLEAAELGSKGGSEDNAVSGASVKGRAKEGPENGSWKMGTGRRDESLW